jgi:release factor glutamine methyltransferase
MARTLTQQAAVDEAVARLRPLLGTDARFEAELLLAAALGVNRATLVAHAREPCDADVLALYRAHVERRTLGEPFAYITGRRGFWTLDLTVTPDVLVPRPETELLVERALAQGDARVAATGRESLVVADLGTGSGAIALAIASARPAWRVVASDISPAALEVARGNAIRLRIEQVEFLEGEWWQPFADRQFDLAVSNPPYVAADDPAMADPALRHEPRIALTPGLDGLAALRRIVGGAGPRLRPGGALLLEHGADQAGAVRELLVAQGFDHVRSHADLAGHLRISEGGWPGSHTN